MKAPDPKWQATVDRFEHAGATEIVVKPDGAWSVTASPPGSFRNLLKEAPGTFFELDRGTGWVQDDCGAEVEVEEEREILVCPEAFAILEWTSYWHMPDLATFTVHKFQEAYEKDLEEKIVELHECCPPDDDDESE